MLKKSIENEEKGPGGLLLFQTYLQRLGRSETWGWRARKNGWLVTINIAGRVYISLLEIDRFEKRAAAGEFSKQSRLSKARTATTHNEGAANG